MNAPTGLVTGQNKVFDMADASSGIWTDLDVAGHRCRIYESPTPGAHNYAVLYLHDVDGNSLDHHPPFIHEFDQYNLNLACPVTGHSWWSDRIYDAFDAGISAERYVLEKVLPLLDNRWGTRPPQIGLLGIGMGGQGALRLAYKYPETFPVVAAISPQVDYHLLLEQGANASLAQMYRDPEAARQDTAILHIHPLNWPRNQFFCCDPMDYPWWDSADRLRMKLASLGVPFECDLETSAAALQLRYDHHMASRVAEFLVERLDQERLRLPTH